MNYTRITISGQEIGLKFGMYSARYLADKLQNGYCFVGDNITEIGIAHVVYSGYLNNCAVKDAPAALTFEDIVDFVEGSVKDQDRVAALASVIKVWSDCQIIQAAGEETKKKSPSKKSKG